MKTEIEGTILGGKQQCVKGGDSWVEILIYGRFSRKESIPIPYEDFEKFATLHGQKVKIKIETLE